MILSLSIQHIIIVAIVFLSVLVFSIWGIYKLIKTAVKKGTKEAIEEQKPK